MVQLSATRCSCIAILWVSLVSFAAITLCVASQRVFIVASVYFIMTQSGNFWIHRIFGVSISVSVWSTQKKSRNGKSMAVTCNLCSHETGQPLSISLRAC